MLLTEWSNEQAMRVQRREGVAEGEARGEAKGEAKKQREIAKKLLTLHIPFDTILEATGLSPADIKSLQGQSPSDRPCLEGQRTR
jgi:predicted transposase/invertase (TIGR01784 family)